MTRPSARSRASPIRGRDELRQRHRLQGGVPHAQPRQDAFAAETRADARARRASAQPLRYLDFLNHQPVRSALLHRAGVAVLVPAPERFAVHKLIVSELRRADRESAAKARKDREQAPCDRGAGERPV